jgi:hypothetical protein
LSELEKLIKQDVIIIGATIKSPKLSMALSGILLTFTRNGLEIFGHFLFQGKEPPRNVMNYIPLDAPCMV